MSVALWGSLEATYTLEPTDIYRRLLDGDAALVWIGLTSQAP